MTTETLPEVTETTNAPELELTQPEDAAPTESTPAPEVQAPDEELEGFLKEKGLVSDGVEGGAEGEQAEDGEGWLKELPDPVRDRIQGLLEERKADEEQKRRAQTEGRRRAFLGTKANIRAFLAEKGIEDADIQRVERTFDAYHAHSTEFAQEETALNWSNGLYKALGDSLGKSAGEELNTKREAHKSYADMTKDYLNLARKGYVKESEVNKAKGDAVRDYRDYLLADPARIEALRSRAKAPEMNGGGAVATSSINNKTYTQMTPEERASLTPQQRDAAVQREYRRTS